MTLHWVMYEKSIGMCAADLCENVLDHARECFVETVHVLSAPAATHSPPTASSGKGGDNVDKVGGRLVVVGDSELACAAREARALHGMLTTIHEVRLQK